MENVFKLSDTYGMTNQELSMLLETGRKVSFEKGETVIAHGAFDDNIYFVLDGILRCYTTVDGMNTTSWFATRQEFFIDLWCYKNGKHSPFGLEASTAVEAIVIPKNDFEEWCGISVAKSIVGRKLFEGYATAYELKLLEYFKCTSAEERYLMIMQNHPEILQQIPLNQLASYLCITPQSLSRIRRQIK